VLKISNGIFKIHSAYHTPQFQLITQHSTQHMYYRTYEMLDSYMSFASVRFQ